MDDDDESLGMYHYYAKQTAIDSWNERVMSINDAKMKE